MKQHTPEYPDRSSYGHRLKPGLSVCALLFASLGAPVLAQNACDSLLNVDFTVTVEGYVASFTDLTTSSLSDVHYYWDYGDGVIEHLGEYQYTYADTGTYTVCLSVSGSYNGDTCAASTCHQVRIDLPPIPPALLVWPQPFTDWFSVKGTEVLGADQAELFDPTGRSVTAISFVESEVLKFSFPEISAGCYLLQLTGAGIQRVIHVMKE